MGETLLRFCFFVLVRTSRERLYTSVNDPIKSRNLILQKKNSNQHHGKEWSPGHTGKVCS